MNGVLLAESAILVHLKTIGIVFLVLSGVVIALFALRTSQCDFNSHDGTSRFTEIFLGRFRPGLPRKNRRKKRTSFSRCYQYSTRGSHLSSLFLYHPAAGAPAEQFAPRSGELTLALVQDAGARPRRSASAVSSRHGAAAERRA